MEDEDGISTNLRGRKVLSAAIISTNKSLHRRRSFLGYFTGTLLSDIFGPSVVKYGILSNSNHSKLRAVSYFAYFLCHIFHAV